MIRGRARVTEKCPPSGSPWGDSPRAQRGDLAEVVGGHADRGALARQRPGILESPDPLHLDHHAIAVARAAPSGRAGSRRRSACPVSTTSPGSSGDELGDRGHQRRDVEDEQADVFASCMRSPLSSSEMSSECGSPTSSGVTRNGPSGVERAQFLPGSHWCVLYW